MQQTLFLRRVLALDSLSCIAMAVLLLIAAQPLAPLFARPVEIVQTAGGFQIPTAAFMGWLATRANPPSLLVWFVIVGNVAWTIESFVVIGQFRPSAIGALFVAAQALTVLTLAALEYVGLRRIAATA